MVWGNPTSSNILVSRSCITLQRRSRSSNPMFLSVVHNVQLIVNVMNDISSKSGAIGYFGPGRSFRFQVSGFKDQGARPPPPNRDELVTKRGPPEGPSLREVTAVTPSPSLP